MYIAIGVAMTLTIILSLSLLWIRARKIDELENLEKEIVRYDEDNEIGKASSYAFHFSSQYAYYFEERFATTSLPQKSSSCQTYFPHLLALYY